ncbi:hypothetical protein [Psychrosphaera haliotis]|uniref:Uncharacterized protein n=1 Tax=Psychrosphaera haliotis TaxID=555083 RepID=A0A6N8FCG8_9GAMM|nr:hypothetical protein [Psychrosphaera haliotis]MUH73239.1 hypothetical protein [Psychrosphaera haliotis]
MNTILKSLLFVGLLSVAPASLADNSTQQFASCLVDNLNGKERKKLAKWIFFAMAAHPEIESFSNITANNYTNSDKAIGSLITRLLTENCSAEMKAAYKTNPQAIEQGFELVGQVAMQELMSNDKVMTAITSYSHFTDQSKINSILVD